MKLKKRHSLVVVFQDFIEKLTQEKAEILYFQNYPFLPDYHLKRHSKCGVY